MIRGLLTIALLLTAWFLPAALVWAQPVSSPSSAAITGEWQGTQGSNITAEYAFTDANGVISAAKAPLFYSTPDKRGNTWGELSRVQWNGRRLTFLVKYSQKDPNGPFHGTEAIYDLELKGDILVGTGRNLTRGGDPFTVTLKKKVQ